MKVSRIKKTYPKLKVVDNQSHPLINVVSQARQSVSPKEQKAFDKKHKSVNWDIWR